MFAAAIALWFSALFGMGSMALRAQTLEAAVRSFGIDLVIPAAAPPLGFTARLLIAFLFALVGGLAGYVFASAVRPRPLRYSETGAPPRERPAAKRPKPAKATGAAARGKSGSTAAADDNDDLARLDAAREAAPQRRRGLSNLNSTDQPDPFAAPMPPLVSAPSILNLGELDAVEPLGQASSEPVDELPDFWRDALHAPAPETIPAASAPVPEPERVAEPAPAPASPPLFVAPDAAPFTAAVPPPHAPQFTTAPVAADQAAASVDALFTPPAATAIAAPEPVSAPTATIAPVSAPNPAGQPERLMDAPPARRAVIDSPSLAAEQRPISAPSADAAPTPPPAAEIAETPAANRLVPRAGTAAQVLRTAPLHSLGVVELVERFALALAARQERDAAVGELRRPHVSFDTELEPATSALAVAPLPAEWPQAPADPLPQPEAAMPSLARPPFGDPSPPAVAAARPFDMPAMLRSTLPSHDGAWADSDDGEPLDLGLPPRSLAQVTAPAGPAPQPFAPLGLTSDETTDEDATDGYDDTATDSPDAADLAARQPERFSSLLDMKPLVRPAATESDTPPVRLTGGPAIAEQAITEDALRSALAALQRMSGAA